jgi:hypothetical protein
MNIYILKQRMENISPQDLISKMSNGITGLASLAGLYKVSLSLPLPPTLSCLPLFLTLPLAPFLSRCPLSLPLSASVGAWPYVDDVANGTAVEPQCMHRSPNEELLGVGDEKGCLKVYHYPCVSKQSVPVSVSAHDGEVSKVRFTCDNRYTSPLPLPSPLRCCPHSPLSPLLLSVVNQLSHLCGQEG